LLSCAVFICIGGDSAEAEKNVVVVICKFLSVVLHLAIRVGFQPIWSWACLLTGTQQSRIVISPSFCPEKIVSGVRYDFLRRR
jgi:hypothetical protein